MLNKYIETAKHSGVEMNILIVGCGQIGVYFSELLAENNKVTVIDKKRGALDLIQASYVDSGSITTVLGDATLTETLIDAKTNEMGLVLVLTGSSTINGLIALKSKLILRTEKVLALFKSNTYTTIYESFDITCLTNSVIEDAISKILSQTEKLVLKDNKG